MIKRMFDIVVSATGLIISAPITLTTAVLISKKLGRPVLFKQTRPGKNGEPFEIYKFRTMTDERDDKGQLLSNSEGPRPLLMEYLPLYNEEQKKRHDVKPGITGWAQINGRNAITWEQKFKLDLWYVQNQSIKLDIYILYKTILNVLKRKDINASETVSMKRFEGNKI